MKANDIIQIVMDINEDIYDLIGKDSYLYSLEFRCTGYYECIYFLDDLIWNNEDFDRDFIDEIDDYEPLKDYLMRQIHNKVEEVGKLKNIERLKKLKRIV